MSANLDVEQEEDSPVIGVYDREPIQAPQSKIAREATRYLITVFDYLTPSRKRDCKRLRLGGHEVTANCLGRTGGFLQRGRLTPLETGGEPILEENAPDDSAFFPIPQSNVDVPQGIMQGSASAVGAIPAYPGDEISSILNGSSNHIDGRRIGIVESKVLIGHKWNAEEMAPRLVVDPYIWEIQRYFFPQFPVLPRLIVEVRELIERGIRHTKDTTIIAIAEDYLTSIEIGSLWATETLDSKERMMKQPVGGMVHVYSELEESLLEQMGRSKVEQGMATMATQFASIAQSGQANIAELVKAISSSNKDFVKELLEGLAAQAKTDVEEQAVKPKSGKSSATKDE